MPITPECQQLLERIFAEFGNREAAESNPDVALEALLNNIAENIDRPGDTLRLLAEMACLPGAPEEIVSRRRAGERVPF
jgi:hypothetical protein